MNITNRLFSVIAAVIGASFGLRGPKKRAVSQTAIAELLTPVWREKLPSGGELLFYGQTRVALYRGWTCLTKEPDTIAWIDGFAPGSTLYDVGANVGVFSLYSASRGHAVVALEPVASNFWVLNRNIELNKFRDKVTALCVALDRNISVGQLFLESNVAGSSSQYERAISTATTTQGAVCMTLDSLWGKFGLPFPDHIKIDVDGTENRVIEGAHRTLADARLKSVHIEINSAECDRQALIATIEGFGFRGRPANRDNITFLRTAK